MGSLAITSPPLSIARELWRLGETDLAARAAGLSAEQAVDIAIRAGELHESGEAHAVWPHGPGGTTPALMLAAIEYLEGNPASLRQEPPPSGKEPAADPPGHRGGTLGGAHTSSPGT